MQVTEKIRRTNFTIGFSTTLFLGHLTGSAILYEAGHRFFDYCGYLVLGLFLVNTLCFLSSIILQLTKLPDKRKIMKAALGLLLNIPIGILFLILFLVYGA